jgi:hypothetical protein
MGGLILGWILEKWNGRVGKEPLAGSSELGRELGSFKC